MKNPEDIPPKIFEFSETWRTIATTILAIIAFIALIVLYALVN